MTPGDLSGSAALAVIPGESPPLQPRRGMSRPVSRVLSSDTVASADETAIHLGSPLPTTSSVLPVHSGGQPSNAHCLNLLLVGFT